MFVQKVSNFKSMRLLLRDAWITALVIAFIALTIHRELNYKGIILGIGIALGYILAYTLNDYFDAEEDAMSQYKGEHNFFVHHKLPFILAITLLMGILGIMLIIFSSFGSRGIVIFILSIIMMWAYSVGPLHLRNRPFFDVIIHAMFIISYPYFIILFLLDLEWLVLDYFLLSIFIVGSAIIQLENQIRDYDLDIINGNNTTISVGIRKSNNLIKLLTILTLSAPLPSV
ncbi:MAG: UbiA family prenyltransferase, partial [Candidatus Heimdallarchaeota archaeon]